MSEDDSIMEFGFDDAGHIKPSGMDKWKQTKSGEVSRVCLVSFNRFHDGVLKKKAREKDGNLSDEEKLEILTQVDTKLAEKLGKKVDALTDVDRLDIKSPKFWNSFTHFDETLEKGGYGLGTFRCLSKWRGSQMLHQEQCCKKFGEPEQKVACAIMTYPMNRDKGVDVDLLKDRKYTEFFIWVLSAKKFKKIEQCYTEARGDEKFVIDLKVELDGDPKYQKQLISVGQNCVWAKPDFSPEVRTWILEQGIRASQQVNSHLGFKLSKEKLLEKLERGKSERTLDSSSSAPSAALASGYDDLIS